MILDVIVHTIYTRKLPVFKRGKSPAWIEAIHLGMQGKVERTPLCLLACLEGAARIFTPDLQQHIEIAVKACGTIQVSVLLTYDISGNFKASHKLLALRT